LDDFVYIQDGPDNIAQLIVVLNDGLHFTVNTSTVRYSYSQAPGACKAEGMQLEDFDGDGTLQTIAIETGRLINGVKHRSR
jgi:hypothetical protein